MTVICKISIRYSKLRVFRKNHPCLISEYSGASWGVGSSISRLSTDLKKTEIWPDEETEPGANLQPGDKETEPGANLKPWSGSGEETASRSVGNNI